MNIYLLRHGETEENAKKSYYGGLDVGISEKGIRQCINVKKHIEGINFDRVYLSESKRAYQSAEIVLSDSKNYIVDSRINELSFGEFEGKSYEDIKRLYPKEEKKWRECWKSFSPPGGESYVELYGRVESFMKGIETIEEDNILVVTHGGIIRAVYTYILGGNLELFWKFSCKNCDIALIKYEYGNWFIDSIIHGGI
ncbi:alpha-ribazole phosphatase [Clostridium bovifaecis]|uniref:Alpha-ribazole phosphatase n=1 Tax=Clostridium bovifaecis TaxID=2184719 RepID=A0A6I6EPU3_9CLOT|nr:alpha-ribazole phosphatase [Clostridium bovifaecis]